MTVWHTWSWGMNKIKPVCQFCFCLLFFNFNNVIKLQIDYSSGTCTHSKAFGGLLLQSLALHSSISGCRVVALSCPRLLPAAAGGPGGPAAPAAINSDDCGAEPHVSSFVGNGSDLSDFSKIQGRWRHEARAVVRMDGECEPLLLWVTSQAGPL